ncbi:MAG: rRNA maturation RNase YbeY [Acidimicrobiales bacterium]
MSGGQHVVSVDEQTAVALDRASLAGVAAAVLRAEGVRGPVELGLRFVDEAAMTELHHRHLDGEGPTDVLAFPLDAPGPTPGAASGGPAVDPELPTLVGDVVICPAVAERNATARHQATADELALLVVHGTLHVLGWDHAGPDEEAAMWSRQQQLLERCHRRPPGR